MGNNGINNDEKYMDIAGHFDGHVDVAVQCQAHLPMEHISGVNRSHWHWMSPSGECLHRIAPTAATVDNFDCKHTQTNKKCF
jgi:hypothetical protein